MALLSSQNDFTGEVQIVLPGELYQTFKEKIVPFVFNLIQK